MDRLPRHSETGFTLLASLLLLMVVSGVAVGLVYLVTSETRIGGSDLENNLAHYGAEAAMEKMMADLGELYTLRQAPTVAEIQALASSQPNLPGIGYAEYVFNVPNSGGFPQSQVRNISSGPYSGLVAQLIPMTLQVSAQRPSGAQVRMLRSVEVAQIPVFQFGVFSDSDLSYFPGPAFDFAGRVHTNGNLFLADGNSLTFHHKVTAVGEIIRAELANGVGTAASYTGTVNIPTAPQGCDGAQPACRSLQLNEGSKVGGPASADNSNWSNISITTYNSMVLNGSTGAKALALPFVAAGMSPAEIIRRPLTGENPTSLVGQARLYNSAQIRVLLSDNPNQLPGGAGDAENVQLDNAGPYAAGVPVAGASPTYFGRGLETADADWVRPPGVAAGASWPLMGGYLRVEIRRADGTFIGVTRQWLELGFARGLQIPRSEAGINNTVHPNAILIFQMQADRNGNGTLTDADETTQITGAARENNWYPINLYDTREGEVRDISLGAGSASCAIGGIMNVVELDVRNLRRWLTGAIGTTGIQTESSTTNGYVLYFSDRRGMLPNGAGVLAGEYGFEDMINPGVQAGTPNAALDNPEDVNQNGTVERYGANNLGDAFGLANGDPTLRLANCTTTGRKNRVTAARRTLMLIDGSLGNVPTRPDGTGGFTVASEQPVYVQGNYNASNAGFGSPHAAASVVADSATLLSNNWNHYQSFLYPTYHNSGAERAATTTWFRLALASGKNLSFPQPTWAGAAQDLGTDGGVHNFLRYLEDWGGATSNYSGSLVSLYYSQYAVGIYKCCSTVYSPPTRAYAFDTDFLDPVKLPPGTPRFRDVVNVGYRQDFTPY